MQPGHRLLDAGCGTGGGAAALAELVGSSGWVVGVDASAAMIAEAQRRATGLGLPVEFEVGDVHRLLVPFRDLATAERFMFLGQTLEQARGLGLASATEADAWWRALVDADQAGTFFCGLALVTVTGRRP